jgi:hypothetical protein
MKHDCDIGAFVWLEYESIGLPTSHIQSVELFRSNVVQPSLRSLDAEINRLEQSEDETACFLIGDFGELFQRSVEGFLIALQCMWERGLRNLILSRQKKLVGGLDRTAIERATWGGKTKELQRQFEQLLGLPIDAFDSYQDLDLLQNLGSAIRHGDGQAARKIYDTYPTLWFNWIAPGTKINVGSSYISIPNNGPLHPSFENITLTESLLEQMFLSVQWFWEDIEMIRCNSFKQKPYTVAQALASWPMQRIARAGQRRWPEQYSA